MLDSLTKQLNTHQYDYFVAASGLRRTGPVVPSSLTREHYLLEAERHAVSVEKAEHGVTVVGGGAVGVERAATLKVCRPHLKVTLVHSRGQLLSSEDLPDETKERAGELLKESGVEVLLNRRVIATTKVETSYGSTNYELGFDDGSKLITGEVVMATSRGVPTTQYLPPSAVDEAGYVKIKPK